MTDDPIRAVSATRKARCIECRGTGYEEPAPGFTFGTVCPVCKGAGWLWIPADAIERAGQSDEPAMPRASAVSDERDELAKHICATYYDDPNRSFVPASGVYSVWLRIADLCLIRERAAAEKARAEERERMLRIMEHVVENAIPGDMLACNAAELMMKVRRSITIARQRALASESKRTEGGNG